MATARARRALAALVLATAATSAFPVDFGTLFTSPEERARLDRLRRGEPEATPAEAIVQSADPRVTGYVRRSDGRNTVWIDGRPVVVSGAEAARLMQSAPMAAPPLPDGSITVAKKRPRR
jgi:hypothetical protein